MLRGSKRVKGIPHQVKVHKLNEMGDIVDKKGHRAWDMACGLQLGIRINVRVPLMCYHRPLTPRLSMHPGLSNLDLVAVHHWAQRPVP